MLHDSVLPLSSPLSGKCEPAHNLQQGLLHGPAALQLHCSKEHHTVSALHVMLPYWHLEFAKIGAVAKAQNQNCHPAAPPGNT